MTTISSADFTSGQLATLLMHSARVFSAGSLPLSIQPVTSDGFPVTGVTEAGGRIAATYDGEKYTGMADAEGGFAVDTDEAVPFDTVVTVLCNRPFRYTTVTRSTVLPGQLLFGQVPPSLPFTMTEISQNPKLHGCTDPDWSLEVVDSRVRSGAWYLYASIDAPMTNAELNHSLPDILIHVNGGGPAALSATPLLVYTGEGNGGSEKTAIVKWEEVKGVLLTAADRAMHINKEYSTGINWTLTDTEMT